MKTHITNVYGMNRNSLVSLQHRVADVARKLGFFELGIYRYPVETDSDAELQKRLDGICAAVEPGDKAVLQLPTGNGIEFEFKLISKLRGMGVEKIVLIVHDPDVYEDMSLLRGAERVIYPTERIGNDIAKKGLYAVRDFKMSFDSENESLVMRNLLKATDFYECAFDEKGLDSDECIQVAFGLYDKTGKYTLFVGTVIQSVLENTLSKVCFHIFHDHTLTKTNKEKLIQTVGEFGSYIQFHEVNPGDFEVENESIKRYTIGTLFRLIIPRVLSRLDKLIYLDADLLVNRDIKELWDIDIAGYSLAAVKDIGYKDLAIVPEFVMQKEGLADRYFNAGVLLMNLSFIRNTGDLLELTHRFLEENPDAYLLDQDALNYYFNSSTLLLDDDWNVQVRNEKRSNRNSLREDVIYHFVEATVMDYYDLSDYEKLYLRMKESTPWVYQGIEDEIHMGYRSLSDKIACLQAMVREVTKGKKKIIYGHYNKQIENLLQMTGINENDYFIHPEEKYWGQTLEGLECHNFEQLKQEKPDSFVVFVLPQTDGGNAIQKLEKIGLEERKDYFVIPRILVGPQGGYWN
ncbi:Lipopolysaccharide biosynthesis protein, LPS:glycosyltransferase [Lachnospiraceae bacterium A10]|nr:Lipopolysaccharide biosynthesis protein, LPS:glycosyltransferase [Lachnospiraceae bacterium A10]